jgi:hypothetical protein
MYPCALGRTPKYVRLKSYGSGLDQALIQNHSGAGLRIDGPLTSTFGAEPPDEHMRRVGL